MVLGLSLTTFTLLHVGLNLLAIIAGLAVVGGLAGGARLNGWTGLFLNVFVLITQLFHRVPALIVLVPKQQEPPFLLTQLVALVVFVWLGRAAVKGFSAPAGRLDPVFVSQAGSAAGLSKW